MASPIRHPKDFWTGLLFLCVGASAFVARGDLEMGTANRMGAAYFPLVLAGLLILIGMAGIVRSCVRDGEAIEKFHLGPLALILGAVILFGVAVRGAGLVPTSMALILISAYASPKFQIVKALMLAVGLSVFAGVLFTKLLGLPIPVIGTWFGA
jgi:putative tricarboxylic transport membrane protein